jgi:hypothetical protein
MPQAPFTPAACMPRAGGLLEEVESDSRGQEATYRARCILVDTEPKVRTHGNSRSRMWLTPAHVCCCCAPSYSVRARRLGCAETRLLVWLARTRKRTRKLCMPTQANGQRVASLSDTCGLPRPKLALSHRTSRGAVSGAGRSQAVRQATQQVGVLLKGVPSICGQSGRGNNWAHGTMATPRVVALLVILRGV